MTTTDSAMTAERLLQRLLEVWDNGDLSDDRLSLDECKAAFDHITKLAADLARVEGEIVRIRRGEAGTERTATFIADGVSITDTLGTINSISTWHKLMGEFRQRALNAEEALRQSDEILAYSEAGLCHGCKKPMKFAEAFRCFDCRFVFCEKCCGPHITEMTDKLRAAEAKSARLEEQINDAEECMQARLHGARVGNEAERVTAVACWEMALHDVRRIFNLTLPQP